LISSVIAAFAAFFATAMLLPRVDAAGVRQPLGVYAHINVNDAIGTDPDKKPTAAQLHTYLQGLYSNLLADPAISGIALGAHWDQTQPNSGNLPSSYDWSFIDDAFTAANAANKTIQLIITPGVNSPSWLLAKLPSCDSLFTTGSAPADCGTITFAGIPEQFRADTNTLPLPWNSTYQAAWTAFLKDLNARYGPNPAFVAIAVAGAIAASDEMILPTTVNTSAPQPSGLSPDQTWAAVIKHSFPNNTAYQNTDQAFIDSWDQAIDAAESIFTGITLFLGPDAGQDFPNFSQTITPHSDNTLFAQDCSSTPKSAIMSCEAKTEILSYFLKVTGPNGKGTQVGGMNASSRLTPGNIGIAGVKVLTGLTPPPAAPLIGGAEFDYAVSDPAMLQLQGCPDPNGGCTGLTPEEGAYNTFTAFFYNTPAASFYGGQVGTAPIQYVEVPLPDLMYSLANPCPPTPSPILGNTSLHDLYARASRDIFAMANQTKALPAPTCSKSAPAPAISLVANAEGESATIAPNAWVEIKGSNLAQPGDTRIWQGSDFVANKMPTALDNVSVKVNGRPAYVYYISPLQINILTPPDALSGSVSVVVTNNGQIGAAFNAPAQSFSPSFFVFNGGPYVAATHADGSLIGPSSLFPGATTPAAPGETIVLYANGFGSTNVPVQSGSITQSGTLSSLPAVKIGGVPANVQFAGLVSPGEFQFNVVVPSNTPNGDQPISASYNGFTTQSGTLITVHP
jgi:uncharacterized protein (TIGR03437 family)